MAQTTMPTRAGSNPPIRALSMDDATKTSANVPRNSPRKLDGVCRIAGAVQKTARFASTPSVSFQCG